jgi:hypothetical protein
MREDRRNRPNIAGRFGSPRGSLKMFEKNLVYAIVHRKNPGCGTAELSLNLVSTLRHGSTPDLLAT